MARTVPQMVQDVIRETRGQASGFEAKQAVQDALNFIDGMARWEFLIQTQNINIVAPYSTGTVNCGAGSDSVSLSGGTWDTTVNYWEIKFADRNLQYKITLDSATTGTLDTVLSGTTNIVGGAYILYKARYALPSDCQPGQDLDLKGPWQTGIYFDGNLPKRERMIFDRRTSEILTATFPMYYTDAEFDETNMCGTIRIEPYPRRSYEFRLTYYRTLSLPDYTVTTPAGGGSRHSPTPPVTQSNQAVMLPESFERAPILIAASNILRKKNMQGWQTMRQEAGDMLNKMYNRYAASAAYEGKIDPSHADLLADDTTAFASDNMLFTRS